MKVRSEVKYYVHLDGSLYCVCDSIEKVLESICEDHVIEIAERFEVYQTTRTLILSGNRKDENE